MKTRRVKIVYSSQFSLKARISASFRPVNFPCSPFLAYIPGKKKKEGGKMEVYKAQKKEDIEKAITILKIRESYLKRYHAYARNEIIALNDSSISLMAWIIELEGGLHKW